MIARFIQSYELPLFWRWASIFTDFDGSAVNGKSRIAVCEFNGDLVAIAPVDFMPSQRTALISSLWVKRGMSDEDARLAGNALDEAIARECAVQGIRSFLIVVPQWKESPVECVVSPLPHQIQFPELPSAASYIN
ncbi:MAG: hypothetical protein WBW31_09555 [Candidatus Sulfotelmatobacter sp.]